MLSSDRPGTDPELDSLGYKQLAKHIALSICEMPQLEGFVVGLYGRWGSGKTTALNYIEHYFSESIAQKPVVIRFNPWWFSGHEDVARSLLEAIANSLNSGNEHSKKAVELIKGLVNSLEKCPIPVNFGALGLTINSKDVAKSVLDHLTKPKDIPHFKEQIGEQITLSQQRLVVFIDDIDRLSSEEIRQVFRAVKALADFQNVTYVVAFDKDVVANALEDMQFISGSDYLKKIIQAPFELPIPSAYGLRKMFYDSLEPVFKKLDDKRFDQFYFENVMRSGVFEFLKTPRDVVRLANTLLVSFQPVINDVNPTDFIAIESLRVFYPDVYEIVRTNKNMFAGISSKDGYLDNSDKNVKEFHEDWSKKNTHFSEVKELLIRLFPKLEKVWNNTGYSSSILDEWRTHYRVCSPDRFDTFFAFGLHEDLVTRNELDQLISNSSDQTKFCESLKSFSRKKTEDSSSRIPEMLEQLLDFSDEIEDENISTVIKTFFEIGDDIVYPEDQMKSMQFMSTELQISWIVFKLLERMPVRERAELLIAQSRNAKALHLLIGTISHVAEGKTKNRNKYGDFLTDQQLQEAQENILSRIETLVQLKETTKLPRFAYIFHYCEEKMPSKRFDAFKMELINCDKLFLHFLNCYINTTVIASTGDKIARKETYFGLEAISKIFPIELLISRIEKISDFSSDENRKNSEFALNKMRQAITRKNKPITSIINAEDFDDDEDD